MDSLIGYSSYMKKYLLVALFSIVYSFANAQDTKEQKFEIGLHHPLSIGDNFMEVAYNGILGLDLKYRITETEIINPKVAFSVDYFNYNAFEFIDGSAFIYKPKIIGDFNIKSLPKFHPFIMLGYSFFSASLKYNYSELTIYNPGDELLQPDEREKTNYSGLNYGFGASYDISNMFFAELSIDFITLSNLDDGIPDDSYNKNIQTINIGLGIKL